MQILLHHKKKSRLRMYIQTRRPIINTRPKKKNTNIDTATSELKPQDKSSRTIKQFLEDIMSLLAITVIDFMKKSYLYNILSILWSSYINHSLFLEYYNDPMQHINWNFTEALLTKAQTPSICVLYRIIHIEASQRLYWPKSESQASVMQHSNSDSINSV